LFSCDYYALTTACAAFPFSSRQLREKSSHPCACVSSWISSPGWPPLPCPYQRSLPPGSPCDRRKVLAWDDCVCILIFFPLMRILYTPHFMVIDLLVPFSFPLPLSLSLFHFSSSIDLINVPWNRSLAQRNSDRVWATLAYDGCWSLILVSSSYVHRYSALERLRCMSSGDCFGFADIRIHIVQALMYVHN
jgi:hypothetical protein